MIENIRSKIFPDVSRRLVLVGGIPGSGKSFLSKILSSEAGVPLLSMDWELLSMRLRTVAETGENFFEKIEYRGLTREGWRAARENVLEDTEKIIRSGSGVIVDETFAVYRRRVEFVNTALSLNVPAILVLLATPVEVAIQRDGERSRPVGERNILRCACGFDAIDESEGFEKVIAVRTQEGKYEETDLKFFYESLY